MAEQFRGRDHTVRTSNGGAELLLRAWIATGERLVGAGPALEAVLAFLRERLGGYGDGLRAFPLDPPPLELADPDRLRALAAVNNALAVELSLPGNLHDPAGFGGGDRQARLNWLAKLLDLHELIVAAMPPGDGAPPPPELALTPDEVDSCLLDRLMAWGNEQRRRGAEPDQVLAVLDQAVLLAERVAGPRGADLLPSLYSDRAAQLEAIGDLPGAAGSMRLAAWHAAEPAYQAALEDLADQLEAQTRGA